MTKPRPAMDETFRHMDTLNLIMSAINFIRLTVPEDRAKELLDHMEANDGNMDRDLAIRRLGPEDADRYLKAVKENYSDIMFLMEIAIP